MKRIEIKRDQIVEDVLKYEVKVKKALLLRQVRYAHVTGIPHVVQIELCRLSDLIGHIVQSVQRAGGDPDDTHELQMVQHHHIQHTAGVDTA